MIPVSVADEPNQEYTPSYEDQFLVAPQGFTMSTLAVDKVVKGGLQSQKSASCVGFVQAHGYQNYHGNANLWVRYINASTPTVGAVVVLREGPIGHVSLITSVATSSFEVIEANFKGWGIISTRSIDMLYKNILGYIIR